ncbi:MAG: hypothetical protein MJE12_17790 [Alphaproteobacteria bacterium]|nr:hypothetical protein [Alphaproteobacteria bacterium]
MQRPYAPPSKGQPATDANPWATFTAGELETKLEELRKLIDSGMLTDRSIEHQFTEVGIIENELASRNGG